MYKKENSLARFLLTTSILLLEQDDMTIRKKGACICHFNDTWENSNCPTIHSSTTSLHQNVIFALTALLKNKMTIRQFYISSYPASGYILFL